MSLFDGIFCGEASRPPICPLCNQPVSLENCKTDEDGQAIHETCYVDNVCTHSKEEVVSHPMPDSERKVRSS